MRPPEQGDTWLELSTDELPVATAYEWAVRPDCGAVVLFSGTVRDHAEGRTGVTHLTYEAYEEQVVPKLAAIADHLRTTWPTTGRIVLWHRIGTLDVEESSVIVAVSSPHRDQAFEAARFGIDAVKSTAPIWKRESWEEGEAWGLDAHEVTDVANVNDAGGVERGTRA